MLQNKIRIHIVGGGIQGCFLAIALQHDCGIRPEHIRIYDEKPLLSNWFERTRVCAMQYLRSNSSHSIHVHFEHLRNYARKQGIDPWNSPHFAQPYHRPSLELFNEHARYCLEHYKLYDMQVNTKVHALIPNGLIVNNKEILGLVIYTAYNRPVNIPVWYMEKNTPQYRNSNAHHLYSEFILGLSNEIPRGSIIIGGGISAVQLAISLAEKGKYPHIMSRHPLRSLRFDFNPCYTGKRCQDKLQAIDATESKQTEPSKKAMNERIEHILANRYSGTVPEEVILRFQELLGNKALNFTVCSDETKLAQAVAESPFAIFCTGFLNREDPVLKTLACTYVQGYPIIKNNMQIAEGVFVSGTNAMYRIGPAAPNIIGAHLAWRRMKQSVLRSTLYAF